ncbi:MULTISPECIES: hypothetical protein [Vibrio]|uniref:hypothetical protein n=1 Tax=Vibrio TaxID=662 RepID=UPI000ADCAEA9|nr:MULTISPECIES: hypothetical protein [Vibrio]
MNAVTNVSQRAFLQTPVEGAGLSQNEDHDAVFCQLFGSQEGGGNSDWREHHS